jgi:hypothetical protein
MYLFNELSSNLDNNLTDNYLSPDLCSVRIP